MERTQLDSLIVRIQTTGDEKAFAEFYDATRTSLYGYLLTVVRKRELAEDLLQDAYIKFRLNVQSYRVGTNPTAFLTQIAKNLAFNQMKRARFEQAVDFSEWEKPDSGPSVEELADTTVLDAIKTLSPDEAQIVMLHLMQGLKHREIAEIVEKPLGTVLWSYRNSLNKLKKILEEE